jgi:hypothetical protein
MTRCVESDEVVETCVVRRDFTFLEARGTAGGQFATPPPLTGLHQPTS